MREEEFNKSDTEGFSKDEERGGDERRYPRRDRKSSFSKKQCYFKKNGIREIDFKDIGLLRRFVGKSGKMLPKKFTGVSPRAQRVLAVAIKRARYMALLPYTGEMGYLDFNLPKRAREGEYRNDFRDYRSEERTYRSEERPNGTANEEGTEV